jgi:hypothetical protein
MQSGGLNRRGSSPATHALELQIFAQFDASRRRRSGGRLSERRTLGIHATPVECRMVENVQAPAQHGIVEIAG